jgi:hypothetical protein
MDRSPLHPLRSAPPVLATALMIAFATSGHHAQGAIAPDAPPIRVRPATWAELGAIAERLADVLPGPLRNIPSAQRAAGWTTWVDAQRAAVAARVAQGDEDSVVNLLLFGTSFTSEPRLTAALLADLNRRWALGDPSAQQALTQAYQQRASDLVTSATKSRADEHLLFVRDVLRSHGIDVSTDAGRRAAIDYLLGNVVRVRQEAAALTKQIEAIRSQPDPTTAFAERSRLFRDRGLSADSSVLTQFAVDRALCALSERGVLRPRSVARVAIVGPGLDFVDKQEGFDFYQPQSLQPFTTFDSLLRCGLSSPDTTVTTIDVSERVNRHLRRAVDRARKQRAPYRLVLPWNSGAGWSEDAIGYWNRAGDQIGTPFATKAPPLPGVRARGVAVRPEIVGRMRPLDASIVTDRLEVPETARFDLVIATNVLLYYDTFEQTLALAAIAAMLRPGGVLLTNDAVLEIPEVPLRSRDYLSVRFSAREGDGERMIWYVRDGR